MISGADLEQFADHQQQQRQNNVDSDREIKEDDKTRGFYRWTRGGYK
jgi:hypothetical protein